MNILKNQKFNQNSLVEVLFYTFPLSFILGNLFLSLHLVIFIVVSLLLIKKEKLSFKINIIHWFIIAFFFYIFLLTVIQFQLPGYLNEKTKGWPLESDPIFKSFILLRYLILILVIDILFINNKINLKKLLIFSLICTSFVSLDVIFQYFSGFDIFGYEGVEDRNSGPFGDEHIAGSYLQRFSFLSILSIFAFDKNLKYKNLFIFFIIVLHAFAILVCGNRMPMILFLFGCFLLFIFMKNLRVVLCLSIIVFLTMFMTLAKNENGLYSTYFTFFKEINIIKYLKKTDGIVPEGMEMTKNPPIVLDKFETFKEIKPFLDNTGHGSIYRTSIFMWKEKPIFGQGLKSFRIKCWEILSRTNDKKLSCATHSHNYYFELLAETGVLGVGIIIVFFILILKNSFFYLKEYYRTKNNEIYILIPIIILFIIEIWPLKSSGSFFTTWNATFLWLYIPLLISLKKKLI